MNRLIRRTVTKRQQMLIRAKIIARIKVDQYGCWITQPSRTGEPEKGSPSRMNLFGWCLTIPVWSYLGWRSKILEVGTNVCHLCDKPRCANPYHVWYGTSSLNALDAFQKGRRKSPFINHKSLRKQETELALGRRRIMIRWHKNKWRAAYQKHYGEVPEVLSHLS